MPPVPVPVPVLVVDDDEGIREAARLILEDAGFTVSEARDGAEALRVLRASAEPRIVLLDIVMPGMTGLDVLWLAAQAQAEGDGRLARHAYIAWPASPQRVPPALLEALGARLLPKPFDLDELCAVVAEAAGRLS